MSRENERDPEEVDRRARRTVKIGELDAEDFPYAPNDFEECVEFIKEKILADPSERDEELDALIYQRGIDKMIEKRGLKGKVKVELKEVVNWEEAG